MFGGFRVAIQFKEDGSKMDFDVSNLVVWETVKIKIQSRIDVMISPVEVSSDFPIFPMAKVLELIQCPVEIDWWIGYLRSEMTIPKMNTIVNFPHCIVVFRIPTRFQYIIMFYLTWVFTDI